MTIRSEGFSEVGISTRDLDGWVDFLTSVAGFEEVWRGTSDNNMKMLWQTPVQETVYECLLCKPGQSAGFIRLFQFDNIQQQEIRHQTHTWDSGGILDIDIRVSAVLPFVDKLENCGWKGVTAPVDWQFGPFLVREWLTTGPDSVTIALIERLSPPLEDSGKLQEFGHPFNSSQVVSDIKRATDFYMSLDFTEVMHHSGPMPGRGGEMLGLPPETAAETAVELVILQSHGVMDGSVELVKFEEVTNRSVAEKGMPYNLGLNLLRFPVSDLHAYAKQIETSGILPFNGKIISSRLEPFGETEIMAIQTHDGVWLEFYQAFT